MTEQQKDKLMEETGVYQGKIFKKKGETNGKEWSIWSLLFDQGGKYPLKFSAFNSLSDKNGGVTLENLKEGETYTVLYKKNPFNLRDGTPAFQKQAVYIKASTAPGRS